MNCVQLIGRLTADPEEFVSIKGKGLVTFTLAVNRYGVNQTADFIKCVCFEKLKDTVLNYCKKGSQIGVVGNLKTDSYKNKDGYTVNTVEIIVSDITFTGDKK